MKENVAENQQEVGENTGLWKKVYYWRINWGKCENESYFKSY